MNNENLIEDQKAQKAMEAVSYLFAVAAEKSNPFIVTKNEFFEHYKIRQLQLRNEDVFEYYFILEAACVLNDNSVHLPIGVYQINYNSVVNLLISSLEDNSKPQFLVLCGWENIVRQESVSKAAKEFLIAYQTLNVGHYFENRVDFDGELVAEYFYDDSIN